MSEIKKGPGKTGVPRQAPKNRAADLSPARKAAFEILQAVERGQTHSDELLRGRAVEGLSAADRNLATALVLGVLRWQIQLDRALQGLLSRPNAKLDTEVRIALRLGAFQILHMDRIPARAAIDESVELAKRVGQRFASAMVNAVLRKLVTSRTGTARAPGIATCTTHADGDLWSEQSITGSHPAWMVERWTRFYGEEAAAGICRHGQLQPMSAVRLAETEVESEVEAELSAAGIELEPGELLARARVVLAGDVTGCAAFREGRVRLQDEGSQLVAELAAFADGDLDREAKSILDACAAPGGKTLILAERNPEARIVACESSKPRLEQMRKRFSGLGERVECRLQDSAKLASAKLGATSLDAPEAFDTALADVPCSGTGTLGRNPEIRHRLRAEDLERQAERQRAILKAVLCAVRPGGKVFYSTCSLEPEENEQVVAAVLAQTPEARLISLDGRLEQLAAAGILTAGSAERLRGALTAEGCLQLLPGRFGTDGFFIAQIERPKAVPQ
jgi:16S rRNA (cytosine967-C5)-methyltransferase